MSPRRPPPPPSPVSRPRGCFAGVLLLGVVAATPAHAALSITGLAGATSSTDASAYTTASIDVAQNDLVILYVVNTKASSPTVPTGIVDNGGGLTWVKEDETATFNGDKSIVSVWRAMTTTSNPAAGTQTINFGSTQTGCGWSIIKVSGADTTGTNGSGAVIQSVPGTLGSSGTSLSVTLAAFGAAGNAGLFGLMITDNVAVTNRSNWTEIHDVTQGSAPVFAIESQYRIADDDASASWSGNLFAGGIALEIAVAAAAGAASATPARTLTGVGQ